MPEPNAIKERVDEILQRESFAAEEGAQYSLNLDWLIDKLAAPFRALERMFQTLSPNVMIAVIVLMSVLVLGLLVHITYSLYLSMKRKKDLAVIPVEQSTDPGIYVVEAKKLALAGNFVDASRKLYLAALTMLENKRKGRVKWELTNREYRNTFESEWVKTSLSVFGELIDNKWYKGGSFEETDFIHCKQAFETIQRKLAGGIDQAASGGTAC